MPAAEVPHINAKPKAQKDSDAIPKSMKLFVM